MNRSSAKLMSMGGGHGDLNVLITDVREIRHSAKNLMNAQNLASQDMQRWAVSEENRAIRDVLCQMAELNSMWADVQRDFIERLQEYRQMFEMILEGEKHVDQARTHLTTCEQKDTRVKKDLKKATKTGPPEAINILTSRLSQTERARDLAQLELTERIRENESVKLIRLKQGLLKASDGYVNMGRKCAVIFTAQKETVGQMPDVHGQELEDVKYTGAQTARNIVSSCRQKVRTMRRSSVISTSTLEMELDDPPPPYMPPDSSSSVMKTKQTLPEADCASSSSNPFVNPSTSHENDESKPVPLQRKSVPCDLESMNGLIDNNCNTSGTSGQDRRGSPMLQYPIATPRTSLCSTEDHYESCEEELVGAVGGTSLD